MTLIELLVLYIVFGLGLAGGIAAGVVFGWPFAIPGTIGGMALLPFLVWLGFLIEPCFTGRPCWPPCRRCGDADHVIEYTMERFLVRCACGRRYVRRGRQCLIVTPGGGTRPYLRWHLLRGWQDEQTLSAPETHAPYRDEPVAGAHRGHPCDPQ